MDWVDVIFLPQSPSAFPAGWLAGVGPALVLSRGEESVFLILPLEGVILSHRGVGVFGEVVLEDEPSGAADGHGSAELVVGEFCDGGDGAGDEDDDADDQGESREDSRWDDGHEGRLRDVVALSSSSEETVVVEGAVGGVVLQVISFAAAAPWVLFLYILLHYLRLFLLRGDVGVVQDGGVDVVDPWDGGGGGEGEHGEEGGHDEGHQENAEGLGQGHEKPDEEASRGPVVFDVEGGDPPSRLGFRQSHGGEDQGDGRRDEPEEVERLGPWDL
mmetsp:Transcript_30406/g.98012  ORF Transcript_30406/g.98012 Transcript_30406/m.98012 type:complete len:273 (+) Transcript_30406:27-845(+)